MPGEWKRADEPQEPASTSGRAGIREATSSGKNCRPTRASKAARSPRGRTSGRPPRPRRSARPAKPPPETWHSHGPTPSRPTLKTPTQKQSLPSLGSTACAGNLTFSRTVPSCRWRSGVNSENRRLLGSAAGSEARWPPSCAALGEAHFLGLGIGTNQSTLPVGADLIRRTPPIALSGAFAAFSASVRNRWPRRWVFLDKDAIGGQEEPAALGISTTAWN